MTTELPPVDRRRVAITNLVFHYSAVGFAIVQGVVLVPLYLGHMSTATYGGWLATGSILAWIELLDPGISAVLQQRVAFLFGSEDSHGLSKAIGTGLVLSIGLSLLPLLALPAAGFLAEIVGLKGGGGAELSAAIRVALVALCVALASYGVTAVNIGLQKPAATGAVFLASSSAGVVVTVAGLVGGMGLLAIPLGSVVRASGLLFGNVAILWRWRRRFLYQPFTFDREELRGLGGNSAVVFVSRVGTTLLSRLDALLAARLISPEATTVLAITTKSAEVSRTLAERPALAVMPSLAHYSGSGDREGLRHVINRILTIAGWVAAVAMAGVAVGNGSFVRLWVGAQHFGGEGVTAAAAVAAGSAIFNVTVGNCLMAIGKFRSVAWLGLAEAALKIPLQIALTLRFGLVGMPIGAALGGILVGGWILAGTLSAKLGEGRVVGFVKWQKAIVALVASVAAATGVAYATGLSSGSVGLLRAVFWLSSVVTGVGGLMLICDRGMRSEMVALASRVRRVRAGAAAGRPTGRG